ncbi:MAG: hypothetical protein IJS15_09040 [Victivallales bacterium]|nr:hypothetical protein [Victivallales bacterium]
MSDELKNPIVTRITSNGYPPEMYRLEYQSPVDGVKDAALIRTPTNGKGDWMVVIHGHGSHETQLCMRKDVRRVQLTAYLELGVGIITPNLRNNAWMGPSAVADMDAILDFLRSRYGAARFFFESGSMGATSNLIYATLRPQNVAGVVARGAITDLAAYIPFCRAGQSELPILGEIADCIEEAYGGTPEELPELYRAHSPLFHPEALSGVPIFLAHGTRDELMPVAQSRRFAAAMATNPDFTYIEVPGGSHDAPLSIPCLADLGNITAPLKWIFG